jgi:hypothetical protein
MQWFGYGPDGICKGVAGYINCAKIAEENGTLWGAIPEPHRV